MRTLTAPASSALPHLAGRPTVTDGGLETELIFLRGIDLPHFAAFPLVEHARGRAALTDYFDGYARVAADAGAALLLETPTWRANTDWARLLGYSDERLTAVNAASVGFLHGLRERYRHLHPTLGEVVVGGIVGPRGDGYRPGADVDPDEAEAYHAPQVEAFAAAGADQVAALTLTDPGEAVGVVRAARRAGLPVGMSFTVETDGRTARGTWLRDVVEAVDAVAAPDYYLVNCAHPQHVLPGLRGGGDDAWARRILGVRYNASLRSHAELDEAEDLDAGDLDVLGAGHEAVRTALPWVTLVGGCCGTDVRHVARLWGV